MPPDPAAGSNREGRPPQRHAPADGQARARREAARGEAFLQRGQFQSALACFREAVALVPQEAAYHVGLAGAAEGSGLEALVEQHGAEATRLAPDDARAHFILGRTYYRNGKFARGLEHSTRAVELAPDRVDYVLLHGSLLLGAGHAREAADALEGVLAAGTTDRWIANLYARIAPSIKQEARALDVVERALRAPNLSADPTGKPLLHFAAATLLDRLGRYDEAFEHARLGNETIRRAAPRHDAATHSAWVSRKINYFTRERVDALPRATHDSARPIFILGMPRSGTTLVEQILACHPAVSPGGEMQSLRLVTKQSADADWAAGESYPDYLDDLSVGRANRLAAKYLADIEALDPKAGHVTDKQPLNFLILDMVELLFPRSRVIHCVRGPLDTCLSCYLTNFELHNQFKHDLADLGAYYHDYQRLMEHWKSVLSVPILDVRYEDLVLDTRGQVRRMLEFLGLPWDERCLRYYENDRPVHTASVDQVRKPIYTASIGRWKHYEKHLAPLIAALGTSV